MSGLFLFVKYGVCILGVGILSSIVAMYIKSSSFSNLLSFAEQDHRETRHQVLWSGEEDRVNVVI